MKNQIMKQKDFKKNHKKMKILISESSSNGLSKS